MNFIRRALLATACILAIAPAAQAQATYPDKPIKIVYTYAPGGAGDALTRLLGTLISPALGQPVIVENRAGASAVWA
jgi:tripartite-type tricarboxylate transporter receptor subunit TctC